MAGEASCIIHSLDRHLRPPQAKCKELAGPRVDGHMGETGLLMHLFFHNTSGVFKLHTPLVTGNIIKTERVPKLMEYTSRETEENQTEIPVTTHYFKCQEGAKWRLRAQALESLPG